jgi:hypothetical protein
MTLGVATLAAFTGAGMSAPSANATCASFFGLGNSANCTSNLTKSGSDGFLSAAWNLFGHRNSVSSGVVAIGFAAFGSDNTVERAQLLAVLKVALK